MKKDRTYSLQLKAGQAKPGQKTVFLGKKAMKFFKEFDELKLENGEEFNVIIKMKENGEYNFKIRGRKTSDIIKKKIGENKRELSEEELEEIAKEKLPYLTTSNPEKAKRIIAGQVKSIIQK